MAGKQGFAYKCKIRDCVVFDLPPKKCRNRFKPLSQNIYRDAQKNIWVGHLSAHQGHFGAVLKDKMPRRKRRGNHV